MCSAWVASVAWVAFGLKSIMKMEFDGMSYAAHIVSKYGT